jgi:hypothetical protein
MKIQESFKCCTRKLKTVAELSPTGKMSRKICAQMTVAIFGIFGALSNAVSVKVQF